MIGPGSEQISIIWEVNDVLTQNALLTREEAMDVLEYIDNNHDANIGVTWEVIQYAIEYRYPEKDKEWNQLSMEEQDNLIEEKAI
tara:strand:- start:11 stop:265 length:255 start_codon:yes stop_codon:yes gene_type:complete